MLSRVSLSSTTFKSNFNGMFDKIPALDERYTTAESKAKTITVLGSSKSTESILDAMDLCSRLTKDLVLNGYNILSGCGSSGIMGAAYNAAKENSIKDLKTGKPIQNLSVIMDPPWGDENIEDCIPIGKATSEAERISAKFKKASETFVIFPGSATTLEEATSLIQQNEYAPKNEPLTKIILVGKEFFGGLTQQYQKLFDSKLLKHSPEELFKVLNTKDEILKEIRKI